MKKLTFLILSTLICLNMAVSPEAGAVKFPSPKGYVNDYAGVLSPGTRSEVEYLSEEIEKKTGAELVVVTIDTTSPLAIEQYAVELFQEWGIGKAEKDNGILILMAVKDRKVRIEVGYGLEGAVTDLQSKIIIEDLMIPAFRKGGYDLGVASGAVMIAKLIRDEYGVELDLKGFPQTAPLRARKSSPLGTLLTFLFFILIFGFRFGTLFFVMSGRGGYWSSGGGGSFGGGFGGFGGGMSGGGGSSGSW
jgi:uncharacterized protein